MADNATPDMPAVFHKGEVSFHRTMDIENRIDELGKRIIRDFMPIQHREFFAGLPIIQLSAVTKSGHPHAFTRTGALGFISSPDEFTLCIKSSPLTGEPEDIQLNAGDKISVVGVEYNTRRRNRMNGTISAHADGVITIKVDQSYGNCPQYIQLRQPEVLEDAVAPKVFHSDSLTEGDIKLIQKADTLFIASRAPSLSDDPRDGVDINHRGGNSGFVEVLDKSTLLFPDYKGNNFYNTLGNIALDNRIGLQFIDFETSTLCNIEGRAEVIDLQGDMYEMPDMGRRVKIEIEKITRSENALPFKFDFIAWSLMLPGR